MKVKQNSFHENSLVRVSLGGCLVLCALCISPSAPSAQDRAKAFEGAATVKLIAQARLVEGTYRSAVAITMPSGSHTYWQSPGDAGVPPVFAFDGSVNVSKSQVLFPVPTRIKEEGLEAFGYADRVVFPVIVTPADPSKPSKLHLDMSFAVCNKICVPGHATADLTLPIKDGADDALVADALATVPQPLPAAEAGDFTATPLASAAKPSWTLAWTGKTPVSDVFASAPEGATFDTHQGGRPGTWILVASDATLAPGSEQIPVSLTLAGGTRSFTTTRTFDLSRSHP